MQLVINTFGTYLKRDHGCFLLTCDGKKRKISTRNIDSILITTNAAISTDAIQLALERNIEIQFLDQYGFPKGKIWHCKLGSTTFIRRRQLEISSTEEGTDLIKTFMEKKTDNCIEHLTDLSRRRSAEKKDYIRQALDDIRILKEKQANIHGKIDDVRQELMGYEGNIARHYFRVLSYLLPERYQFNGRSSRPAKDEINCLLNYGYGILYSRVEKACLIAGLDPYVGILHTDGYNKTSFVFDIIECFRIYIDRLVMKLFAAKAVKKNYFKNVHNGMVLDDAGKRFFVEQLNEYFTTKTKYQNRSMDIGSLIQATCHRVANQLIEEVD